MNGYVFKRLTKESVFDLHLLFLESFKTRTTLIEFEQKYNTDYLGVSYIGFLAYDEKNKPVAFNGVIPVLSIINDNPVLIAQSTDTLTHPDHQYRGLNLKLALMTYELSKAEGIHFLFGIPNENSFPVFINRLHWIQNGNMQKFQVGVPMLPISQVFRKHLQLKLIYRIWVNFILLFFKKANNGFENPNISKTFFGLLRNNSFFVYKEYLKKHILIIGGKKVWIKFDGTLKIGDIENPNKNFLLKVLRRLKLIAFFTGIQKIQYQCSPESECFKIFSEIVPSTNSLPIIFLNLSNEYQPENLVLSLGDIDTF